MSISLITTSDFLHITSSIMKNEKKNLYPSSCLFADDSRSKSNVKLSLRHWLNPNMLTLRFCIFFGQRWAGFVGPLYFLYTFLMMFRFVISNCRVPPKTYYVMTSVTKNPVLNSQESCGFVASAYGRGQQPTRRRGEKGQRVYNPSFQPWGTQGRSEGSDAIKRCAPHSPQILQGTGG